MSEPNEQSGNILIGADVSIQGTLLVPNRAVVNGSIEGEVTARELVVGPTGRIVGHVRTEKADIHGEVHETLVVNQSLILRATGRVLGQVHYRELEIEKGGLVEGSMSQTPAPQPIQELPRTAEAPKPPVPIPAPALVAEEVAFVTRTESYPTAEGIQ